jgi:hypothetical protein
MIEWNVGNIGLLVFNTSLYDSIIPVLQSSLLGKIRLHPMPGATSGSGKLGGNSLNLYALGHRSLFIDSLLSCTDAGGIVHGHHRR